MSGIVPDPQLVKEIEEQRPSAPAGLLSTAEKDRLIERAMAALYRWYVSRSQVTRNWNADKSFDWRKLRTDHSPDLCAVIEGFFAIEQYVPDYVTNVVNLVRRSHGRSHYQIRWGAEEERHANTWLNALLFLRHRTPQWIEDYAQALRAQRWELPWESSLHMACYATVQERATQLNYLNTAIVAQGKSEKPELTKDADPVLAEVAQTIAIDEAAHYGFFSETVRLFLYYYPARTLETLAEVVQGFAMPALNIIPNAREFYEAVYRTNIYGHARHYAKDVLQPVFENLSVVGRRALTEGVKRMRQVPDPAGNLRDTAIFEMLDYGAVEQAIKRLFGRLEQYEQEIGFAQVDPTLFVPSGLAP